MKKKFEYIESYYDVTEIIDFFNKINDPWSKNIHPTEKSPYGLCGCSDVSLHLEIEDNPIHGLLEKIFKDFGHHGKLTVLEHLTSIRYQSYPFLPHSDISPDCSVIEYLRSKGAKKYLTFVLPLTWKENVHPGTAFFNSPPLLNEDLYREHLDVLPHYTEKHQVEMSRYSVAAIFEWKNPGDLIVWEDFVFHSTTDHHTYEFSEDPERYSKSFLSIRAYVT